MGQPTESGHKYRRKLPHFRVPGAIYHARFSIHPDFKRLKSDYEFRLVQESILFFHNKTCVLIAYVIMPNHSHAVLQPLPQSNEISAWCDYGYFYKLESILGSIKKYSSRRINKIHDRIGKPVWKSENFDRIARSEKDLDDLVDYIHGNPVRWKLVKRAEDYLWSSASTIYSGRSEYRYWFCADRFSRPSDS